MNEVFQAKVANWGAKVKVTVRAVRELRTLKGWVDGWKKTCLKRWTLEMCLCQLSEYALGSAVGSAVGVGAGVVLGLAARAGAGPVGGAGRGEARGPLLAEPARAGCRLPTSLVGTQSLIEIAGPVQPEQSLVGLCGKSRGRV